MRERSVARAMIALAVVVLAGVSVPRLRLEYAPDVTFPELGVTLGLPPSANVDSAETTRRWVIPIEGALRSLGGTTGTRGEVEAGSATILARFKRGTDIELKAARLASDLAPVRARLPEHATLAVFPARGGVRPNAVFAVTGAAAGDAAERIAEKLRSTPGVRDVRTFGTAREEMDVRLTGDAMVTAGDVIRGLTPHPLGEAHTGSRRLPLIAAPGAIRIRDLPLTTPALVRLGAIAEIRQRREEPTSIARLDGRPAAIVSVFRDDDAQLLAFDRAVRRVMRGEGTVIWSDAAELRVILRRLIAAAVVASVILALGGGLPLGLYVLLAIALAVNVWQIASLRVDAQTLMVSAVAIAAIAPFAALRTVSRSLWPMVIAAFFVILLPVAATLSSGALAPLLAPPARDFAIAAGCALAAATFGVPRRSRRFETGGKTVKRLLRNSPSVVLACLAVALFFLSWFGARLDPRRSRGSADRSRVFVRMRLPSGATLAQTTRAAKAVEDALRGLGGIERFWTSASAESAVVVIEVEPRLEQPQRFDLFQIALRARIPASYGTVTIENSFDRGAASALAESIEEQPYADDAGSMYRFLLKGTDADVLRRTAEALTTRIAHVDVPRAAIRSAWPAASPRIELVPVETTPPAVADAVAAELSRLSFPPLAEDLPDGTVLRVALRDAPAGPNDVPRRIELFARPMRVADRVVVVENAFDVRPSSTEGAVTRELGRFVLPMDVGVPGQTREQAIAKRLEIDRSVSLAALPAGVIAERPQLGALSFSIAKLRLAALAAFLPLLIVTASAIALASLARAVVALIPPVVSVAFVAPVLAAASARLDEMTLLATGAAVCCVSALAVVVLLRIGGGSGARAYHTVRAHARPLAVATIAAGALIIVAASARPAIGDAWRAPLLAAAAVIISGIPTALILPAAVDALLRDAARRRGPVARAAARPAVWSDSGALPHLSVRNVTKFYASGFRALHRVSFELTPGVIGLLGPNGAGKTTLLRMLTGLLQPTRGTIAYCGVPVRAENIAEFRRSIGFLPQEFNAYAGLTAAQFLDFWALERGMDQARQRREQIEELLAAVGLEEHANRRVRDFSGGMRQRIGIARALLGNPPLLIVDEPTTGLDIEARHRFRDLLIAVARRRIVILSSHIASDVETTAMRLLLLARGQLRWEGSVEGLLARARGRVFEAIVSDADVRTLAQQYRITARVRVAEGIRVRGVAAEGQSLPGDEVKATLEEAYLSEVSTGAIRRGSFAFVFSS